MCHVDDSGSVSNVATRKELIHNEPPFPLNEKMIKLLCIHRTACSYFLTVNPGTTVIYCVPTINEGVGLVNREQ